MNLLSAIRIAHGIHAPRDHSHKGLAWEGSHCDFSPASQYISEKSLVAAIRFHLAMAPPSVRQRIRSILPLAAASLPLGPIRLIPSPVCNFARVYPSLLSSQKAHTAFCQDSQTLVSGSDDAIVRWDIDVRRPVGEPLEHLDTVIRSAAASPDGRALASVS